MARTLETAWPERPDHIPMWKPHHRSSALVSSLLCLWFLLGALPSHASGQQTAPSPETARGIEIYRQGDLAGAIKLLGEVIKRHSDDAYAWYYLGLAYNSRGLIAEARPRFQHVIRLWPDSADAHAKLGYALILANEPQKAIAMAQRAIELGDQSPESHYAIAEAILRSPANTLRPDQLALAVEEAGTALRINPNFAPAMITKSFALLHLKRYAEAGISLEEFVRVSPDDVDVETWRLQLAEIKKLAAKSTDIPPTANPTVLNARMVTQHARVFSKPEPSYTEAARKAGVGGTVVLRAIFTSGGEVKDLFVRQALGYGLTTKAIEAARRIKFQPAVKDGTLVSMYVQLEYNFNLY